MIYLYYAIGIVAFISAVGCWYFGVPKFLKELFLPLKAIKNDGWSFFNWLLLLLTIGIIGIWLPLFLNLFNGEKASITEIITNGSLTTFSLVLLSEGIVNLVKSKNRDEISDSGNLKALAIILSTIFIILNAFTYVLISDIEKTKDVTVAKLVFIVALLSMLLAVYLYCFRGEGFSEGASEVVAEDDDGVASASAGADDDDNPIP
ncbi:hypothetical protein [Bacteriovorax sp. DB6_IX]|uniref:hypothetical protein n=1 Tax=Bacteriovorax sp. DB6_IX TaxID=1353530 RepID=UPI00038A2803|nr:hypothetical protein [Bacteriovorax sp. DB6_IX]EQC44456.1 hypothetical protein M901_0296 [Bacteriovorax sp. DB6_IX]